MRETLINTEATARPCLPKITLWDVVLLLSIHICWGKMYKGNAWHSEQKVKQESIRTGST